MDEEVKENLIDKIFFKKYRCVQYIGEGSFSYIYKAEYNNGKYCSLKLEDINDKRNFLANEASIMIYLKGPNIPYIITYGSSGGYNILAMQLLGNNLQTMLEKEGTFSLKTVCLLGFQMISILEQIHNKGIIHRDIKPENFLMGKEPESNPNYLYLIDFGVSKYFDKNNLNDIITNKRKLTGTPRYASINALRGLEQSMRDDLESVGYILIYFLKGTLPWIGLEDIDPSETIKKICIRKIETSSFDLCSGLPKQFIEYFDYCKNLEFDEMPDYIMLKDLFMKILKIENEKYDYIYDWNKLNKNKNKKYKNSGFYSKSTEIGNVNILPTEDNRPIKTKNINYIQMFGKIDNKEEQKLQSGKKDEIKEDDKVNKDNENEKKNNDKEEPTTCCLIY